MGIPETALHPQELPLDDHSVICLHSLTRLALPVITTTRGCGCLINPKQPCVVSIVTYRVTMGRTEIFKFDASTHHLRSCSSIHRTLVLRAIDFSRPFIFIFTLFVDSRRQIARSQNRNRMCEIRLTKLSCAAQQVGIVHFYAVTEIKGLSCRLWWIREWRNLLTSTHVGYRSVIRAVASGASLKFGVQGASATNWFSWLNGARDNGIRLYLWVRQGY